MKTEKVPIDDSIEIIGDDVGKMLFWCYFFGRLYVFFFFNSELVSSGPTATSSTDNNKEIDHNKTIVDLTCSDSDDDEPLAKRRMVNPKPDSTIKFSGWSLLDVFLVGEEGN